MLQCVAVSCGELLLQYVAVCCSVLQCVAVRLGELLLQYVAVRCSILCDELR